MKIIQSRDYKELARLNKAVHNLHVNLYPDYFTTYIEDDIMEEFKKFVAKENFHFLILSDQDENKGFIFYEIQSKPKTPFKKAYTSLYVYQISVLEEEQGKGYGFALMDKVHQIARGEGLDCVELDYWVGNLQAKNFYKKQGFDVVREFVRKDY